MSTTGPRRPPRRPDHHDQQETSKRLQVQGDHQETTKKPPGDRQEITRRPPGDHQQTTRMQDITKRPPRSPDPSPPCPAGCRCLETPSPQCRCRAIRAARPKCFPALFAGVGTLSRRKGGQPIGIVKGFAEKICTAHHRASCGTGGRSPHRPKPFPLAYEPTAFPHCLPNTNVTQLDMLNYGV